nr:uncharacterized protein LOC105845922 [Hydra vulgaris]
MKNTKLVISIVFFNHLFVAWLSELNESSKSNYQFTHVISMSHNDIATSKINLQTLYDKVEELLTDTISIKQKTSNENRNKRSQLYKDTSKQMCSEIKNIITNDNDTYEVVMKFNSNKVDYFKSAASVMSMNCESKSGVTCETVYETKKYAKLNITEGIIDLIGNVQELKVGICCKCLKGF